MLGFAGADEPSEGTYEPCMPLQYAMDPRNDVILAQYTNGEPLPPDYESPVRVVILGYLGWRCVKKVSKIRISDKENDSHYLIWDNRVLPNFVTEKDGEFVTTMFTHPSTACNEQNLNSLIMKPAQEEKITLSDARKGKTYRTEGYTYDGGGHELQSVEFPWMAAKLVSTVSVNSPKSRSAMATSPGRGCRGTSIRKHRTC